MTDHPHAKLLAAIRDGLLNAEDWFREYERLHLAKGTPDGNEKAEANRRRADECQERLTYVDLLATALETAPSASLVEAAHPLTLGKGTDFRTELDFRLEVATLVDPRVRRKMVRPETRRRILERADWIIKAIRERYLTAHPAADAPPSENDR